MAALPPYKGFWTSNSGADPKHPIAGLLDTQALIALYLPVIRHHLCFVVLMLRYQETSTILAQIQPIVVWKSKLFNACSWIYGECIARLKMGTTYNLYPIPLFFLQFNHQGTITVNEEGTEAAFVTSVGFMPLSAQIRFIVDRPFLFLIYEHRTSCLLFLGKVSDPSKL